MINIASVHVLTITLWMYTNNVEIENEPKTPSILMQFSPEIQHQSCITKCVIRTKDISKHVHNIHNLIQYAVFSTRVGKLSNAIYSKWYLCGIGRCCPQPFICSYQEAKIKILIFNDQMIYPIIRISYVR